MRAHAAASASTPPAVEREPAVELGKSGVFCSAVGAGVWAWGDKSGYWGPYDEEESRAKSAAAYDALKEAGITFIDSAEVYGFGESERFVGDFVRTRGGQPQVATKFAPLPWRIWQSDVPGALRDSLARLGATSCTLYQQHWPGFLTNGWANDAFLEGLADCKEQGLCEAVGVSNFNAERLRRSHQRLALRGVPLASNQIQYSLLYREPERNGVLDACKELGVTPIAYSPLAQGLLTGKYAPGAGGPAGPRQRVFSDERLREIAPIVDCLKAMAEERGLTAAAVAINWCVCKGTVPIPGVKTEAQAKVAASALGWRLSDAEVSELDAVSAKLASAPGAPFEQW